MNNKFFVSLRNYFFTGLAISLPLFGTCYILLIIFVFTDGLLGRFINAYLKAKLGFYIPGLGILLFLLVILLFGVVAKNFLGKKFVHWLGHRFENLPLLKQIYPPLKQIVDFFFSAKELAFKKVVLVEYPRKGLWSLGFITNEGMPKAKEVLKADFLNVFVPNTPGPLSGYYVLVPRQEAILLDISIEDALKIIISGGVLNPGESLPEKLKTGP
ncbi:MAG: DUF502 domain-containing protein [Candidatus Omnitrophica bacterium]|nr:DUF502 domain-containing protein [Candidatus Omnitrophota bacterium]MDD5237270.1 DUF502 domain-containing protein [Candidatus Omnitrophota bacterium]MDD5611384.1 DUF502 domain-containing protein [Candidatus Omnitrophota bacterium]